MLAKETAFPQNSYIAGGFLNGFFVLHNHRALTNEINPMAWCFAATYDFLTVNGPNFQFLNQFLS